MATRKKRTIKIGRRELTEEQATAEYRLLEKKLFGQPRFYIPPVRVEVHAPEPYAGGGGSDACYPCEEVYTVRFATAVGGVPSLMHALDELQHVLVGHVGLPASGTIIVALRRDRSRGA